MKLRVFLLTSALALGSGTTLLAQINAGDFAAIYGVNYSSGDRKGTIFPGFVGPTAFVYRPWCRMAVGIDDDTFVSNHSTTGIISGTGDLGFEGHLTLWTSHSQSVKPSECPAKKNSAFTIDYVSTVPVPGALESKELVHQFKATYNHPLSDGDFFANAGIVSAGLSSGGTTQSALLTANYLRNLDTSGTWAVEGETDLQSSSKLGPSSASVLFAIDVALGKNQEWGLRFGAAGGLTPYSPKISPFLQLSYLGSLKPKREKAPASVLKD
ncbi:MAG TPA: hypothetical protein VJN92_01860 [Candidatus Acidoferrum sp.]|nr:hypothetical protein [Candidatus Acidoferrum sp.]